MGVLKQIFISHSSKGQSSESQWQHGEILVRALVWIIDCNLVTVSSQSGKRVRPLGFSLIKALILFMKVLFPWANYLPGLYLSIPLPWKLGSQHVKRRGHKYSVYNTRLGWRAMAITTLALNFNLTLTVSELVKSGCGAVHLPRGPRKRAIKTDNHAKRDQEEADSMHPDFTSNVCSYQKKTQRKGPKESRTEM